MVETDEAAAYRSRGAAPISREVLTAKAFTVERAQRVIDLAQRIREGATEVRKPIVARELLEARELTPRQAIEWI